MMSINSHTEWDSLQEVILGTPSYINRQTMDLSFKLFYHDNLKGTYQRRTEGFYELPGHIIDECHEDVNAFESLLKKRGIIVKRPKMQTSETPVSNGYWTAQPNHALNARDLFLVIGNRIIETAPMVRSRYFETLLYNNLLHEYAEEGAEWILSPRSSLEDQTFDLSAITTKELREWGVSHHHNYTPEIMFDGAQCIRMGRDIVFNANCDNHLLGLKWLKSFLGNDYRIHRINIDHNHIDTAILPLRPGMLLMNADKVSIGDLPGIFDDWDIIKYHPEVPEETEDYGIFLSGIGISMNVLSLSEKDVVVSYQTNQETELATILYKNGFNPIPVRMRHSRKVGGALHCITLDVRRDGELQSYF